MGQSLSVSAEEVTESRARQGSGAAAPRPGVAWWVHGLVVAAVVGITGVYQAGMWGWTYDDAFIIYRYARNFAAGLGMVYNPGEHYLGTSSAGYTLLLAALHWLAPGVDFLDLGSVVSSLGRRRAGVLMWGSGVEARTPLVGALATLGTVATRCWCRCGAAKCICWCRWCWARSCATGKVGRWRRACWSAWRS